MPHYANAPIAEAVIDVQFAYVDEPSIERMSSVAAGLRSQFPQQHRIAGVRMVFEADTDGRVVPRAPTSGEQLGVRLTNGENTRILQIRRNGISYIHLPPYSNWESFLDEAVQLIQLIVNEFHPISVPRVAVRYINKIAVPIGSDLDDYLNLTPRLLEKVGSNVEGYFLQLVLPQTDLGTRWKAIVNTGLEAAPEPGDMLVLLDIDMFCEETTNSSVQDISAVLSKLRGRKNDIFEAAITDKVRDIIK